jgi:uncharacterized damage-inducible protein DinB
MYTGTYYQLMADYNRWMNRSLYTICAEIPDAKRKDNLGAFFKSLHGTLNHIVWGDRVWLRRFTNHPFPSSRIGEDVFADFNELRAEREKLDEFIIDWAENLPGEWLAQPFQYTSAIDAKTRRGPAWVFVTQLFNHQTHHRGQATTLIKQLGYDPGVTDIPWLPGAVDFE